MKHSRSWHSWITPENKTKRQKCAARGEHNRSLTHSLTGKKDERIERYFADMFHRNKVDLFIDPIATDAIKLPSSIWRVVCALLFYYYIRLWALFRHSIPRMIPQYFIYHIIRGQSIISFMLKWEHWVFLVHVKVICTFICQFKNCFCNSLSLCFVDIKQPPPVFQIYLQNTALQATVND